MNNLKPINLTKNNPCLVMEYQENISQALENIQTAINVLEKSDNDLDQKIALAQEIINNTIDQFHNLNQKANQLLAQGK